MKTVQWEITIAELNNTKGKVYKITRRIPTLAVAETKIFRTKEDARRQYELWLQ